MIDSEHPSLSIARQCQLVSISRSGFYYQPSGESEFNLMLMRLMDEQHMRTPFYGARQMVRHLRREGYVVSRKRVRRLMQKMGLCVVYQRPRTTVPAVGHEAYPYLLRELVIERPTKVCAPISRTFPCSAAISTWLPSWIGQAARYWPGGCQIQWIRSFASKRWRRHWQSTARPRSSIPIRVASSPRRASQAF